VKKIWGLEKKKGRRKNELALQGEKLLQNTSIFQKGEFRGRTYRRFGAETMGT